MLLLRIRRRGLFLASVLSLFSLAGCALDIGPSDPAFIEPHVLRALPPEDSVASLIRPATLQNLRLVPSVGARLFLGERIPPASTGSFALTDRYLYFLIWDTAQSGYRAGTRIPLPAIIKVELAGPRSSWVEIETRDPAHRHLDRPDETGRYQIMAVAPDGIWIDRDGSRALCEELARRLPALQSPRDGASVTCT